MAEAQERTLKANMSSVDASIRSLKEQVQRMKSTVQQVRAQCANDLRKRDLEMQKLRSHLADRQRGNKRGDGVGVTTISIIPAVVDRESSTKSRLVTGGEGIHDPGYSLRQETTGFLTQLCQNLSDENDNLIMLARSSIQTLKDLQGLGHEEEEHAMISSGSSHHRHQSSPVRILPSSHEELSSQMSMALDHLSTLLTNPSFVPLEEVEVRDEEIKRLRESWEIMENKWKQAVFMMDRWNQRISDGGRPLQIDGLWSAVEIPANPDERENEEEEEEGEKEDRNARATVEIEKPPYALQERNDNPMLKRSPRKVGFVAGIENSPANHEEDGTLPVKVQTSNYVTQRPLKKPNPSLLQVGQRTTSANNRKPF